MSIVRGVAVLPLAVLIPAQEAEERRFPDFPHQDMREYALDLKVDVGAGRLEGTVEYVIGAVEPLTRVRLHARRSGAWEVAFTDGDGTPLEGEWKDDRVVLELPLRVEKGDEVRLRARLSGVPVDGFYFRESRHGDALAFTDHYSIRARGWLPCEDHPADRARWRTRVVYPEGMECVGYGVPGLGEEEAPEGWSVETLESEVEIPPYMYAVMVGPYVRVDEEGHAALVDHYVYAGDRRKAGESLQHHGEWLERMEETFGPYAYGKYTTVQCPTRWGGFEAPGNVQLSEALFDRPDGGVGTLAHELVHMWFGDAVGYARWHEVWLSEGFASYFGPWLHARAGGPPLREAMARLRLGWSRSPVAFRKSIRDRSFPHPDRALNANTYPKGAWVLHMLRQRLGDETFFAALKAYFLRFRGRSVVTDDFVGVVEEVSGEDLEGFFAQWLDRPGCPVLDVGSGDGGIVVRQVQDDPFEFPLRLRWKGAGGGTVERVVDVTGRRTVVPAEGSVTDIELDPDVELLFVRGR